MAEEDKRIEFLKSTETGPITDAVHLVHTGQWMKGIHPANPNMKIAGRAMTVQFEYIDPNKEYIPHMMHLYKYFKPGDVMVVSAKNPGAMTGEHVIRGAMNTGFEGVIIDGNIRDYVAIGQMEMPTFCTGHEAFHSPNNFRAVAVNIPIECCGATVNPGDYLIGDEDGVIVIPADKIDEVIYQAEMVIDIEEQMSKAMHAKEDPSVFLALSKKKHTPRT
jgi:regulator of RNase E activity RraA